MARTALVLFSVLVVGVATAPAQSRLYAAATTAVEGGARGNIPSGAVPSAGGLVGVRLTDAWSIEVEADRGFRTTTAGTGESLLVSFPPSPNPTPQEIESYGIRARFDRTQTVGAGWSAHAVWRGRQPKRLNVGLLAGVSSRIHTSRVVRTTTFISPLVDPSLADQYPDETSTRRMAATGLTGGLLLLVRITRQLTLAPEFRVTSGLITNDRFTVVRSGVRAMWSF
jgi:hypothetical protein